MQTPLWRSRSGKYCDRPGPGLGEMVVAAGTLSQPYMLPGAISTSPSHEWHTGRPLGVPMRVDDIT